MEPCGQLRLTHLTTPIALRHALHDAATPASASAGPLGLLEASQHGLLVGGWQEGELCIVSEPQKNMVRAQLRVRCARCLHCSSF